MANTSGNVLGQLDFLPNLKDPMHDSAMNVNATQQSSIRLAVASSAPVQAGQDSILRLTIASL